MKYLICSLFFLLVGCGSSSSSYTGSPKGRPEVIIQHAELQAVADECARWMLQNGFSIDFTNTYSLGGSQIADTTSPFGPLFNTGAHVEADFSYAPEGDNVHLWADLHHVSGYYGDPQDRQWMQEELVMIAKSVAQKR